MPALGCPASWLPQFSGTKTPVSTRACICGEAVSYSNSGDELTRRKRRRSRTARNPARSLPITVERTCLRLLTSGHNHAYSTANVTSDQPSTMLFLMEFPGWTRRRCQGLLRQISAASLVQLAIRSRSSARRVRSRLHRGRCVVLAGVDLMAGRRDGDMTMVLEGG